MKTFAQFVGETEDSIAKRKLNAKAFPNIGHPLVSHRENPPQEKDPDFENFDATTDNHGTGGQE